MIKGAHVIIYSRERPRTGPSPDVLGYPHVDAGGGWLIFKVPPAEVAVHPTDGPDAHEFYPICDDVTATVDELAAKGVQFAGPVRDDGWGLLTAIRLPGGGEPGPDRGGAHPRRGTQGLRIAGPSRHARGRAGPGPP
jgi:hypothetical protein